MTVDYSRVAAVANRVFQEPLNDLIARSNPTLRAMEKRGVASDRIYLKYKDASNHGAGGIADGAEVTFDGTEGSDRKAAVLDFKTYISKFRVTKRTMAQMASQPGSIGRILQDEIQDAALDLADKISTDLWGRGGTATQITGIQAVIDTANTYAGVDRSLAANSGWRGLVKNAANGATAGELSTNLLYSMDDLFFARNKYGWRERASMFTGILSPGILTKYSQLFTSIDLASLSTSHFVNQMNNTGNLGDSTVGFLGVPFARDAAALIDTTNDLANTGRLYILDMSKMFLATLAPGPDANVHQVLGAQTAPVVDGLRFEIEFLGNKGESVEGYVRTYVELVAPEPPKAGVALKNVNAVYA